MKFSERWLREWVSPDLDTDGLVHQLTMAGLEVDSAEPAAGAELERRQHLLQGAAFRAEDHAEPGRDDAQLRRPAADDRARP